LDKLIESKAKVVQTSSIASNLFAKGIDVNNLQNEGTFVSKKAYGESKLCNIFFTRELHRLYYEKGITAVAFEPGIVRSNFAAEGGWFFRTAYHTPLKYLFTISTQKSAKRMVRLVEGEEGVDFIAGKVYSYKKEYHVRYEGEEEMAKTLWKECENLLKEYL
jgi:NAD(P)-dependent dehydrogenase (short-subunit alcohol dehydrogenase family)